VVLIVVTSCDYPQTVVALTVLQSFAPSFLRGRYAGWKLAGDGAKKQKKK
jgi:hypothetical protein